MTFAENLKTLRNSRGISQKDLAEALGFSFQSVSKWERNESWPDVETLVKIAVFFATTTDALLGHAPEERFSSLVIDKSEAELFSEYPKTQIQVAGKLVFSIDSEGKIAAVVFIPAMRSYNGCYIRKGYDPFEEKSTVVYSYTRYSHREKLGEEKRIKVPENGFLIVVSNSSFAAKKIMKFITPEEYSIFLNPDTHQGYYSERNGKSLFGDILKRNELDDITVELTEAGVVFKKPLESVDPMSVNIETLAKIVRKELKKERDEQIRCLENKIGELEERLEELECMVDDNESNIDDLQDRIDKLGDKD